MKWCAISGSWRTINTTVKKDVGNIVQDIIHEGNGIVTGGALGVDYIATQQVIKYGNIQHQIKIYLPITLNNFCKHYHKRAQQNIITHSQAELITSQLKFIQRYAPENIVDDFGFQEANEESYYARNSLIITRGEELFAFQVNNSKGTQDAIDKARRLHKPTHVKRYSISSN